MAKWMCLLVLAFTGVGCSSLNVQKPTAAVTGMAIKDVNSTGFTMDFDVDVKNPNTAALPLSTVDYKLGLSDTSVLEGKAKPEGSIPAGGSKSMKLPVTLTYENLLAAEQAIVKSGGNIPYALNGGLSVNTGSPLLGNLRVPLEYKGTLPLKDILSNPQAMLQNPAARKLAKQLIGGFFNR